MKKTALALSLSTLFAASVGFAQTKPDGQWHGALSLGASFAAGNTQSSNFALLADAARATAQDKISLYGSYLRTSIGNQTCVSGSGSTARTFNCSITGADITRLGGRYDWNLTNELFAFAGAGLERDKVKGIKLHSDVNAGVGLHVLKDANNTLDVFAGLGYGRDAYFSGVTALGSLEALLGEESSHKLSETTTFKQRLVVYPAFKSERGTRGTFDASLSTALVNNWTLNVGLLARFNSKVASGVKSTDTLATVGVGMKF